MVVFHLLKANTDNVESWNCQIKTCFLILEHWGSNCHLIKAFICFTVTNCMVTKYFNREKYDIFALILLIYTFLKNPGSGV